MLARLRQARGRSQQLLAAELCAASGVPTLSRHEVSRWERQLRVPGAFWLGWLAVVLAVPAKLLADAAGRSRRARRRPLPAGRARPRAGGTPVRRPPATHRTGRGATGQPAHLTRRPASGDRGGRLMSATWQDPAVRTPLCRRHKVDRHVRLEPGGDDPPYAGHQPRALLSLARLTSTSVSPADMP
ncbi:helix-turn-helix domain-containing protein [Micromonospora sp. ATCC 39149]|uniref:helix-turn-helix domain-containing protein n=1 Tax=Micromonospora sp. (strain ATCC 39149 / NRRL 15099 / SCC 1413) TaxID=219305 RepID=UPI001E564D0E|nr:helix-turn-helix domain-containing protein [Micromonospora sp. ATCC 39149]